MESNIDSLPMALPQTGLHYQIPVLRDLTSLAAGGPLPVADGTLDLNSYLLGCAGNSSYIFGVRTNDFLADAIVAGDKLLVDVAAHPSQGDLIIVSRGAGYQLMRIFDPAKVEVWGVVTGVVRKLSASRA